MPRVASDILPTSLPSLSFTPFLMPSLHFCKISELILKPTTGTFHKTLRNERSAQVYDSAVVNRPSFVKRSMTCSQIPINDNESSLLLPEMEVFICSRVRSRPRLRPVRIVLYLSMTTIQFCCSVYFGERLFLALATSEKYWGV